jgi:hypothetical protein
VEKITWAYKDEGHVLEGGKGMLLWRTEDKTILNNVTLNSCHSPKEQHIRKKDSTKWN